MTPTHKLPPRSEWRSIVEAGLRSGLLKENKEMLTVTQLYQREKKRKKGKVALTGGNVQTEGIEPPAK